MTLIIARLDNGTAFVTSDTLLSTINGERLPYNDGLVKVVIVNPQCCVCFAGNSEPAEVAIAHILRTDYGSSAEILEYLYQVHLEYGQSIDFGVLTNIQERPALYSIKSGILDSDIPHFWLGDHYNIFQKKMSENATNDPVKKKVKDALNAVIQDGNATSVGGFQISISSDNDSFECEDVNGKQKVSGFRYDIEIQHIILDVETIKFEAANEWKSLQGVSNDSITTFSSTNPYFPAISIHYMHSKVGYLFCPHLRLKLNPTGNVLEPFIFKDVTAHELLNEIHEKFGIQFEGLIPDNSGRVTFVRSQKKY